MYPREYHVARINVIGADSTMIQRRVPSHWVHDVESMLNEHYTTLNQC